MAEKWVLRVYGVQTDKPDKENRVAMVDGDPFAAVSFTTVGSLGVTGHVAVVFTKERVSG